MITIGITAVGSGVGQPVLDSLRDSDLPLHLVGFEASPWSKAAYECDMVYRLPLANDPAYGPTLLARCREAQVELLIPGSDTELIPLAALAPALAAQGCRVIVSAPACVQLCRNKLALHDYMIAQGVPFAPTWSLEAARTQAAHLPYPLVLKRKDGSGSVGTQILCAPSDWAHVQVTGDWVVQPYLIAKSWRDSEKGLQPYLDQLARTRRPLQQDELSIQVLVSREGRVLGRFASLNVLKDGVPMRVEPRDDPGVWEATERFIAALLPLGLVGPCNLQGRITPEGIRFFEANLRFTGITHTRAMMGYREVEAAVRHFALGEDEASVRRYLPLPTHLIGLRQMTERVVPRRHIERLGCEGRWVATPPFERVLLTGASGYLGQALAYALLAQGVTQELIAPVREPERARTLWADEPLGARIRWLPWALGDPLPALEEVELLIHAAALRTGPGVVDPAAWHALNTLGTLNLVNAVQRAHVPRLIFFSSQAVYGLQQPPPWSETSAVIPETPYAHSKAAGEAVVQTLTPSGTQWAILRLARLYGLGEGPGRAALRWEELPHRFATLAAAGETLYLDGDGCQRVDLLHRRDAVGLVLRLLEQPRTAWNQVYNVGSGTPVSLNELAQTCQTITTTRGWAVPPIAYRPVKAPPPSWGMTIERARALGWAPQVSIQEGLTELIELVYQQREERQHG